MPHDHDSCTPDLARDLVITGVAPPVALTPGTEVGPSRPEPSRAVSPVVTVTPFNLEPEVIARSAQVPVVVLTGSPVDPGMSALRRDLVSRAGSAGLRWILGVVDADSHPTVVAALRPSSLPTVTVVADGTGISSWTPGDALGSGGVDCGDWLDRVVGAASPRLAGLPADAVVVDAVSGGPAGGVDSTADISSDPRMQEAADLVNLGRPRAAVALYDRMLGEHPGRVAEQVLIRARAAVAVLDRTQGLSGAEALAAVADARGGRPAGVARLLRAADVLVLLDRPGEAVDLLTGALQTVVGDDREELRVRALELCLLLEAADPAVIRARSRIAAAVW